MTFGLNMGDLRAREGRMDELHAPSAWLTIDQIELMSPAASKQSRADCEAISKLKLKAKVRLASRVSILLSITAGLDVDPHPLPHERCKDRRSDRRGRSVSHSATMV